MAADDTVRYRLHRKLDELLGPDEAALLMTGIPPFPWAEVATKRDLDLLYQRTSAELRELRGEVLHEIGSVREEIGSVREELGTLKGEIGSVRGEIGSHVRMIIMANFVSVLTAVGIVVATMQFLA
jgi:hypothetical protein